MTPPLHVLVFGALDDGPCDIYRFGMHREALSRHGVDLRAWTTYRLGVPDGVDDSMEAAVAAADTVLDRSELDWADVLVFRRFYVTNWSCRDCALVSASRSELGLHGARTGHRISEPERLVRPLFTALERYPELLRGRALVYETDDDLLHVKRWNGVSRRVAPEREVIERMLRRADLVTVTTPVLEARHRPYNDVIRVIRNAVEPSWYVPDPLAPPVTGDPRLVYYAKPNRMRDYDVCRPAVDAVVAAHPGARRVWLGALDAPAGGPADPVIAIMDEVGPYVDGAAAFSRSLATARPDIGLAPLVGDEFDQAKSELHWLEYTMAGAATVATGIPGGGPFDAIRDGVDGFLAATPREWHEALERLAGSRDLRDAITGQARERVLAEYTVEARAPEWAEAYRWAAAHAGRAVAGRVHGLGALPDAAIAAEASASLAHRRGVRRRAQNAPVALAAMRGSRVACWTPEDAAGPLVSVLVPVVDEPPVLIEAAVASALAGTHPRVEVVVAVDPLLPREPLARALPSDPRVRLIEVPGAATRLPTEPDAARSALAARLIAGAMEAAAGPWLAPLSPEMAFAPDHVEVLLEIALEHELELVYGQAVIEAGPEARVVLGAWPPNPDGVLTFGTELFSARLVGPVALVDPESWRDGQHPGWAFWSELLEAGVRAAGIEHPVSLARIEGGQAAGELVATATSSRAAVPDLARRRDDRPPRGGARGRLKKRCR